MRKKCIFIRHGKTPGNEEKKYTGKGTDEGLSEDGKKEVLFLKKRAGSFLKEAELVFSSPMKRAKETAKLLFNDMTIKSVNGLEEMDFGDFEGKTYEDLCKNPDYLKWIKTRGEVSFGGCESRADFTKRTVSAFYEIVDRAKDVGTFCIIAHGGSIMAVMSALTGEDYYSFMVSGADGFVLELEIEDERISVITYDRLGMRLSD